MDTNLCGSSEHTHVITSVTYGIDANMIFKYLLSGNENIKFLESAYHMGFLREGHEFLF